MFSVKVGKKEIEFWFSHPVKQPFEVEGLTGRVVDDNRRCTIATIEVNGKYESQGVAVCHTIDHFRKATGRKVALANALFKFSKDERIAVWKEYHKHCCV